ncbi:MAG: hypothetical protein JSV90_04775 [Methanobacteriota archaeon]|nr:MAG: hypothetical protein JSV90_04775 [Euryarchaeota archaeon]
MDEEQERPPVVDTIDADSKTNMVVMRWIRFLLDRMEPDALPELFRYYARIGWISEDVEGYLVMVSEGTRPPEEEPEPELLYEEVRDQSLLVTKKEPKRKSKKGRRPADEGWKLTPEDHLKSWMFVLEIAGISTDRNLWCELGQKIDMFEDGLDEYCRI